MPRRLQCHGCRHFEWGWLDSDRCAAFPAGVPDAIWLGEADHALAHPGDGGVRRAPLTTADVAHLRDVRHHAFWATAFEEVAHAADPLGAIVLEVERLEPHGAAEVPDPGALRAAWRETADAPAMMLVLLRARRARELARAVALTSEQLELEGCDVLDDKGWLGVTLGLASFRTESAFEDSKRAWAALSAPLEHRYLTARVQQTLLRSMRRVVPEPPSAAEWTGPGKTSLGRLEDAGLVLRLAVRAPQARFEDVELLAPWTALTNAAGVEAELARELREGHPLFGRRALRAVARRSDSNEVLFVDDTVAAVVHLTWAREVTPPEPRAEIHPSIAEWVVRRMRPDHDDFTGAEPRSFAFSFTSAHPLEELARRLPDDDRWDWTLRGSHWYGDYIWGKSGTTRVRVFAEEGGGRYTIQADLDRDDPGEGWFAVTRAVATKTLLAAMDATDVQACAPAYD